MSIFIFHTDTLNKYPWEKIRDEYKILKRYDLSFEDIKRLGYKVPYPPSPEMANMKMYPKYPQGVDSLGVRISTSEEHSKRGYEIRANRKAARYFGRHYGVDWTIFEPPRNHYHR